MIELRSVITAASHDDTEWLSEKRQTYSLFLTCASLELGQKDGPPLQGAGAWEGGQRLESPPFCLIIILGV